MGIRLHRRRRRRRSTSNSSNRLSRRCRCRCCRCSHSHIPCSSPCSSRSRSHNPLSYSSCSRTSSSSISSKTSISKISSTTPYCTQQWSRNWRSHRSRVTYTSRRDISLGGPRNGARSFGFVATCRTLLSPRECRARAQGTASNDIEGRHRHGSTTNR